MKGIYVHIPFCRKKCSYCDFVSYCGVREETIDAYVDALGKEALITAGKPCGEFTAYIGGGTPSLLSARQLNNVCEIAGGFAAHGISEFTVECNPESINAEKLYALTGCGVNRMSFGVQSFNDAELKALGRIHFAADAREKFQLARRAGLRNINIDLIYGIPGQDIYSWKKTLNETISTGPEHISVYPLTVEEGTKYFEIGIKTDGDMQADMYYAASDLLEKSGYARYEISNFALPGMECRHNLNYWNCGEYIGLGISAVSYKAGARSKNTLSVEDYINAVNGGKRPVIETDKLDSAGHSAERIMLGLRTAAGVRLAPEEEAFGEKLAKSLSTGLVENLPGGIWRLTQKGVYLSNAVFRELI